MAPVSEPLSGLHLCYTVAVPRDRQKVVRQLSCARRRVVLRVAGVRPGDARGRQACLHGAVGRHHVLRELASARQVSRVAAGRAIGAGDQRRALRALRIGRHPAELLESRRPGMRKGSAAECGGFQQERRAGWQVPCSGEQDRPPPDAMGAFTCLPGRLATVERHCPMLLLRQSQRLLAGRSSAELLARQDHLFLQLPCSHHLLCSWTG